MSKRAELKSKIAQARKDRDQLEKQVAKAVARIDALELDKFELRLDLEELRKRRDRSKDRDLEKRVAAIEVEIAEVKSGLKKDNQLLRRRTANVEKYRTRRQKLGRKINKWKRQLRNSVSPKVVDLGFHNASSAMGPIRGSIGHYTAGAYAADDDQAARLYAEVRRQHMAQGWAEIGYHIGLGPEGTIFLLRGIQYAGAHTLGYNTGYVGFNVHGTTNDTWTRPQLKAFRAALARFDLKDKPVWGHNDFNATACPGDFKQGYISKGKP